MLACNCFPSALAEALLRSLFEQLGSPGCCEVFVDDSSDGDDDGVLEERILPHAEEPCLAPLWPSP